MRLEHLHNSSPKFTSADLSLLLQDYRKKLEALS